MDLSASLSTEKTGLMFLEEHLKFEGRLLSAMPLSKFAS